MRGTVRYASLNKHRLLEQVASSFFFCTLPRQAPRRTYKTIAYKLLRLDKHRLLAHVAALLGPAPGLRLTRRQAARGGRRR